MLAFDAWLKSFGWLADRDRPCIVSADLDGVSCALLQAEIQGWKPVGTYDGFSLCLYESPESINWPETVFIDVEILRPAARSIGNHMISADADDAANLTHFLPHCVNPNLWRGFNVQDTFARKYPFSTLPLLLAKAAINDPGFEVSQAWLALSLHTDSSFTNAAIYQGNALDWLQAMGAECSSAGLSRFCSLLARVSAQRALMLLNNVQEWVTEAGFGAKARACRFDPASAADRAKLSVLITRLQNETGFSASLPFTNPPAWTCSFETAKMPIHTKSRRRESFRIAQERRVVSMAATGRTDEGLSMTLPNSACPVEFFQ